MDTGTLTPELNKNRTQSPEFIRGVSEAGAFRDLLLTAKALLAKQYDRIIAEGVSGLFTLLHHEGPILEESTNVVERLEYILTQKPKSERLIRLQNIARLSSDDRAAYDAIQQPAWAAYDAIQQPAASQALAKARPNNTWNGKSIFAEK